LEWVKAYPHLGTVSLAFIQQPSVDFQLHLVMGSSSSPDVMDLAPPLREWLSKLVRDTITAYISGSHPYRIPLFEWYGEEFSAEAAAAAAAAKAAASEAFGFRRPPASDTTTAPPRQAAVRAEAARAVSQPTRRAAAAPAETAEAAGALPLELSRQIRSFSRGGTMVSPGDEPAALREHAFRPPSPLHQRRTRDSDPSPRPLQRPLAQRPPQWPSKPAARLGSDEAAALPPITTSAEFFGSYAPLSSSSPGSRAARRAHCHGCAHGVASSLGGSNASLASSLDLDGRSTPPLVTDSPRARRVQATRAMELHSGAVGELVVRVHDVVNVVSEGTTRLGSGLAPHVFVCASVGDGEEQRSQPASTSGGQVGRLGVVTPLRSDFRMCVHDNVTQRLRLRVIIKEFSDKVSKEPYEVGSVEVGFAALGFGGSENYTLVLQASVDQMPTHTTQWLRLQLTYVSHA